MRISALGLVVAVGLHILIGVTAFADAPEPAPDFDRYYQIASGRGRPYVDYQVEHPIGTWLVFRALASVPGGRPSFGRGVVAVNACADAVILASLLWAWGVPAALYYAWVAVPIGAMLFNRVDLRSMAAATVAVAAWCRRSRYVTAAALAVGASLKLWPLVFSVALLQPPRRRPTTIAVLVFLLVGGSLAALALILAGGRSILEVLTFRGATGWQIESVVGSIIHLVSSTPIRLESGSWRIGTTSGPVSIALFAAAAPICLWASWRGFRTQRPGTAWLTAVPLLLILSALLSAQYVGWLIPGGAVSWAEGNRRSAAIAAAAVLLTQLLWMLYGNVLEGVFFALALVVIRNVVLLWLALDAGAALVN